MALDDYRFHGMHAEGRGTTLQEAIDDLSDFWNSRPSLVMHAWGVLTLEITIGGSTVLIEITDRKLLDGLEGGDYQPLIDKLAVDMQMDRVDAEAILAEASDVIATVDRIRPPTGPQWSPDPGTAASAVLPQAAPVWVRELAKEVDAETKRSKGKSRSRRGKKLLRVVVRTGIKGGLSNSQISKQTGIPKSTIGDTRERIKRETQVAIQFKTRRPGQRLTSSQQQVILDKLVETNNNAAKAGRELGVSPRTVRDLRKRTAAVSVPSKVKGRWTTKIRSRLNTLVNSGVTPTAAARKLGIPARTARGWVATSKSKK